MPRGLSAAAKAYSGPTYWLADITTPKGAAHFFWGGEREQAIGGNTYQPYLRITEGFRRTRTLQVDAGGLELDNTDLTIAGLVAFDPFEGGLCVLSKFLLGIEETIEIFRGRLTEQEESEQAVRFRLVPELEPAQVNVPALDYSALCRWRFNQPSCGYDRANIILSENLAERTATIFSANTIGDSMLAMTVDEHIDREVLITNGTGRGQHGRIKSNTATTLTLYQDWRTTPDGSSKFRVVTAANGMPKQLFTATSALDQAIADIFSARTIGLSTLALVSDEHKSDGPDKDAGMVRIVGGTGSGQERKIKSNTGTTITSADAEPDWDPIPDGTSVFRVLYLRCPKDVAEACEQRGRTHSFNGVPTISPELTRIFSEANPPRGGGGGGGDERRRELDFLE